MLCQEPFVDDVQKHPSRGFIAKSHGISEILDVSMAAAFLTVSRDTVYHLFQSGQLPGRKVGRKWVTTKAAVLRWVEHSSADESLARGIPSEFRCQSIFSRGGRPRRRGSRTMPRRWEITSTQSSAP